jgi:hypothetical protein
MQIGWRLFPTAYKSVPSRALEAFVGVNLTDLIDVKRLPLTIRNEKRDGSQFCWKIASGVAKSVSLYSALAVLNDITKIDP